MGKTLSCHRHWKLRWAIFVAHKSFGSTTSMTLIMLGILYAVGRDLPCELWELLIKVARNALGHNLTDDDSELADMSLLHRR